MTPQRVTLCEGDFEPIGFDPCSCGADHTRARLLATIEINGTPFHVEGVAVVRDVARGSIQSAFCCDWEELIERHTLAFMPDGGWQTVRLFEHEYVLLIEPHSR